MRKSIAYLVLLLLPWVARAQALADWYYWFDNDNAPRQSGKMSGMNAHLQVDASQLETGAHMLYLQVVDTAGVYSPPMGSLFIHEPDASKGSRLRYWFDGSTSTHDLPYAQGQFLIDASGLVPGFHFINYYVLDGHGIGTNVQSAGFYRTPMQSHQQLHYWFAGDSIATQVPDYQGGFLLDVSRLHEGFNTIYFQMVDNGPTDIESSHFIKIPQTERAGDMTAVCIIDGKVAAEQKLPNTGGVIKWDMDVSGMEVGLHKAMFQVVTPSGAGSSIAETYFIRTLSDADVATMQCSYAIDDYRHYTQKGTCDHGAFHFDLPVGEVEDGLHRIDYMLVAENGATTTQGSDWFYKTPLGGNGITQYDYWLNDKSSDIHSVTLAKSQDPFQLIKLLPVTRESIRSSRFQFEVKDGKPMMYAKNDIHFRFHDKSGRWVDADRQYVDYAVSQEVKDIKPLEAEQTFARPDSNEVRWFSFEAEKGDTVAFRNSQATSIQVFAPSGTEVYSVSGDKSVGYDGCHTWEDGTYHVAIHDVTGSKPQLTLEYFHMDKYDVVDQDVRVVGDGGASTITYKGNGFNDLYAVDYINDDNDTIASACIDIHDNSEISVTTDFQGASLGCYTAVFHFTGMKKVIPTNITVEKAKDITLSTKITYPTSYLRSKGKTEYVVDIENLGNMTSYRTPIYIYISSHKETDISKIKIEGLHLPSLTEGMTTDSLTESDKLWLKELQDKIADSHYFVGSKKEANSSNDSIYARAGYFFADIAPGEKKQLKVIVYTQETVDVWITTPSENFALSGKTKEEAGGRAIGERKHPKNGYCCIRNHIECVTNIAADAVGIANTIASLCGAPIQSTLGVADCALSSFNKIVSTVGSVMCDDNNEKKNLWDNMHDILDGVSTLEMISSCTAKLLPWKKAKKLLDAIGDAAGNTSMVFGLGVDQADCIMAILGKNPDCLPSPPGGGTSTPVNSLDPNDIIGYTSIAGSKYLSDSITQVNYRIEFENDTAFATASAHVVEIKDTLNSKLYDLESYAPVSIKIGEQTVYLDGKPEFVKTVDMRPSINVIAQVEGRYDSEKGISTWLFTSLDPMTMEPTDDVMQGFLPVNYDKISGMGEVSFDINLKQPFTDGTEVSNKASIVFDNNEAIETPVWTNIVDAVAPESHIAGVVLMNDSTARISLEGSDNRSGVWKYEVYAQHGAGSAWVKAGECTADSGWVDFHFYEGMDYGFCVLATDSAGNVERKELAREISLGTATKGDANGDGNVDMVDATLIVNYYLGKPDTYLNALASDLNEDGTVDIVDAIATTRLYLEQAQAEADSTGTQRRKLKTRPKSSTTETR